MSAFHSKQTPADGIHVPYAFVYADAAARTGATGFTADDLGKFARQLDNNSIWMLISVTPSWIEITGVAANPDLIVVDIPALKGSAGTIPVGKLVKIVGYSDPNVLVELADTDAVAFTTVALDSVTPGLVRRSGKITSVNTDGMALGSRLYLTGSGDYTTTPPTNPQQVGYVVSAHISSGVIYAALGQYPLIATESNAGLLSANEKFCLANYLSTGRVTNAGISRAGGRDINVGAGSGIIKQGPPFQSAPAVLNKITWGATSITIPANVTHHIVVDINGVVSSTSSSVDFQDYIVLGTVVTNSTDIVFLSAYDLDVIHVIPDMHKFIFDVIGAILVSGCATTANATPLRLDVSSGSFYIGKDRKDVTSVAPITFTYWYRNGSGGWTALTSQTIIDTAKYDNGSGVLQNLPAGKWKKDALYIAYTDAGPEYHVFYAQEYYDNQSAAAFGNLPTPMSEASSKALRSGGIIVTQGGAAIAQIVDIRPRLGVNAPLTSDVTDHGLLLGLGDDDHPQYILVDGSRAMTGGLTVPTVNGVTIESHKSRHISGGADAFVSTDLIEAIVKRLRESGGADLLLGSITDTQLLQRSGTNIVGIGGTPHAVVSNTSLFQTTSVSDVLVTGMTLTPGAGTYVAMFNAVITGSKSRRGIYGSFYVGGSRIDASERHPHWENLDNEFPFTMIHVVSPSAGQAVDVRVKSENADTTVALNQKSLVLIKVG